MTILRSFNIGVTGMSAIGGGMAVIGDNIANSNTTGFKSSRAEFQDVLARSLKGIDGGDQIGAGTRLAHIKPLYQQGNLVRTENVTDLGVNGNGFFSLETPFGRGYTRDGSFQFDREGNLINPDGYKVMGFKADRDGKITNMVSPIRLGGVTIPAKGTDEVRIQMNIDSREKVKKFDPTNPDASSSYSSGLVVYDNVGTARMITLYFNKVEDGKWEYHAMVKGEDAKDGKPSTMVEMSKGLAVFDNKGVLQEEIESSNSFNFNNGATPGQKIKFNLGTSIKEGGDGSDASTQYGSSSTVSRHTQNGASAATLSSLSFNDDGVLSAVYNNGEVRDLYQIALSSFDNNEGLFKLGKNVYKETRNSGQGAVGKPREGGRGEVLSKNLEQSNVDIASEFVQLMTAQRNFQANTRTVTTADEMLQEVLNLKR